jgi:hypothetical protein
VGEVVARDRAATLDDRRQLAIAYRVIGDLLAQTGDLAAALVEQRKSQELFRALGPEHPEVPDYRRALAASHASFGDLLAQTGDLAGALAEQRKCQVLSQSLAAEHPEVSD